MMPDSLAAIADPLRLGVELRVLWFTSRIVRKDTLRTRKSKHFSMLPAIRLRPSTVLETLSFSKGDKPA
jgi:hypothetical protein